jgi:RNA-dependent RNA polymerase
MLLFFLCSKKLFRLAQNILQKNQVTVEIANILHGPEYSSALLNFDVRLFPKRGYGRRGQGHSGNGALTLPTEHLGLHFLRNYGGPMAPKTLMIANRRIRFEKSKRVARLDVVETIRRLPYLDARALEEREKRAAELRATNISVRAIQFGWECRDSVFSVEWEKKDYIDACAIVFQDDPRELRIKYFAPTETRIIAVRFSLINWTATSLAVRGQPTVFLSLHLPPSFEGEITPERMHEIQRFRSNGTVYDIEPRHRLSAFDDEHAQVAPYTSLAIRLICRTDADVMLFRRSSRLAQLHEPLDFDYPVEHRGLFSTRNLELLQVWLRELDFEVAFQVESLTRALTVDVQEMLDLRADVDHLVEEKGAHYTSALLRHFATQARQLFWGYNESNESKESLQQCFQRSQTEFKLQAPSPTMATREAVFDCLHVIQTPTTIRLEGPFPERSNRVLRSYPGHHLNFLRVSFVDETRLQYRFDREVSGRTFIAKRVGGALLFGISVAGRFFKFLAYSQSALKEHAVRLQELVCGNVLTISAGMVCQTILR